VTLVRTDPCRLSEEPVVRSQGGTESREDSRARDVRRVRVKARRAAYADAECRRHAIECRKVLSAYGIANVTSAAQEWWRDDETFTVLVEDDVTGLPLGGVRLQRHRRGVLLPFERALASIDPRVHALVERCAERGVGELCGLWRAIELRGLGLGSKLTMMGIALATDVQVNVLFGLCDTRNVHANARLGFGIDARLASNGTFAYPRAELVAHVLRIDDAVRLPGASAEARAAVEHYRSEPFGLEVVETAQRRVEIHRDLRLWPAAGSAERESPGEYVA
jgi:hypothetical protein